MPKQVDYDPFADAAPKGVPVDHDPFEEKSGVARYAGLAGRAGVQALPAIPLGLPAMVMDAYDSLRNVAAMGMNKVLPKRFEQPMLPPFRHSQLLNETGSTAADMAGLPRPETKAEEGLTNIGSAVFSALGGAGLARTMLPPIPAGLTQANPSRARMMLEGLAEAPKLQAAGAAGSTLASDVAENAGIKNPAALAIIGMMGGAGTGAMGTVGGRSAAGVRQALAPFTTRGKERLVGEALNRVSSTPTETAQRLTNAQELVPGSRPMVPDVAQDPGLLAAHRAVRGMDEKNLIGQRMSEQNQARQADLDRIAGDEGALQGALDKRGRTFAEMADPAFDNAAPVNIGREWINNPVLRTIQEIRESPAGARQTVREALDEATSMITQEGADLSNARVLYEIRKDLDLLRTGKLSGAGKSGRERANMATAEHQLGQVIRSLDDTIEGAAPGYRSYMQMFAKRSVPISQLQALQSLRERAVLAAPDGTTGEEVLSQNKFRTLLRNNMVANPNYSGIGPGAARLRGNALDQDGRRVPVLADLSPNHLRVLDRIAADLDRGAAPNSANVKAQGSDTFQNMSIAAVLGRVLGDRTGELAAQSTAGKTITAPLNFLYRMPDRDVQLLMVEAWRDPALAGRLMRDASRAEIEDIGNELARRAAAQASASALYGER